MASRGGLSGLALAEIAAGVILAWSGIQNASIAATLRSVIGGKKPAPDTGTQPIVSAPAGGTATAAGVAGSQPVGGVPSATGNPGAVNGCTAAQTASNRALGRLMAGAYGWGIGAQWTALDTMIGTQESGWCNNAQNRGSTAYGIGQFLDTTWASVGYSKTSDPVTQIAAMLAYIKQRYGNPVAAEQFHLANNWY